MPTLSSKPTKIIFVDDDEDEYLIIRDLLSKANPFDVQLEWLSNYDSALAALESNRFDVCLLDYLLGGRTGLDLLQEATGRGTATPIILLTGYGDYAVDMEAMRSGAADFLVKSELTPPLLDRTIRYAMELKRKEIELERSRKTFRDMVEHSLVGIFIIQDGRVVYQNPEQNRLYAPLTDYSGLPFENVHSDDVEALRDIYQQMLSGRLESSDMVFRFYLPKKARNSQNMRWVHCRSNRSEYEGRPAILVNMMDITRTKELERITRIEDKMGSLGRVAAGMAHEIRNPLAGINIYMDTLETLCCDSERAIKQKEILSQIRNASDSIDGVIKRVLDFAKTREPKRIETHINDLVRRALALGMVTLRRSSIQVSADLAGDLPVCFIDGQSIEQVILNLIMNAAEALNGVPGLRKIDISTSRGERQIYIRVSDSGPGVPPGMEEEIFDPFFTSKPSNTGIGLSLSCRIVLDHKGVLTVEKSPMGGAAFTIALPIDRAEQVISER